MRFFSIDAKKTLQQVASRDTGLTENEVLSRIEQNGENKLDEHKKQSLAKKFFAQFKDLMVIILIVSAVISISMSLISKNYGDLFEGGIIVFIVLLNAVMGVVQENKAENALKKTHRTFLRCHS